MLQKSNKYAIIEEKVKTFRKEAMVTKKDLIQEFRSIKHDNFELLWQRLNGGESPEKAFYFLNIKTYSLKYWTKKRLVALILCLNNYIKYEI